MTGWSTSKIGVIWAGVILLALVVVAAIVVGIRIAGDQEVLIYQACFDSGQTAAECKVALG
jgi:hypothetical protein